MKSELKQSRIFPISGNLTNPGPKFAIKGPSQSVEFPQYINKSSILIYKIYEKSFYNLEALLKYDEISSVVELSIEQSIDRTEQPWLRGCCNQHLLSHLSSVGVLHQHGSDEY